MGLSFQLNFLEQQLPTAYGSDLSLKWMIRRPKTCCVASVNGYIRFPPDDIFRAEIGEVYSSAIAPGVIIPCLFILLMKMLMFDLCICFPSVLSWVCLMSALCLYLYVCCGFKCCPISQTSPLCQLRVTLMVMVLTCKTLFPLVIMMPNLQTPLWWTESDLTVLLNPLNPLGQPLLVPLNSDWEAMVVISNPHLAQNLVLNMEFLNLQGNFWRGLRPSLLILPPSVTSPLTKPPHENSLLAA